MRRAPPARMIAKEKVILRRVPEYNPALIEKVVTEGLAEFGLESRVHGRITIKPNVVMSHPKVTPSAYTRAEFLDGLLRSLRRTKCGDLEMAIAEKCGVGIPTSRMFRRAGYYQLKKNHPVRLVPIEEARKRTVALASCPPKHKDLVLWFFLKARILNPLFRMDLIYDGYLCLFFSWCRRLLKGRL